MLQGVVDIINALKARGKAIYLISGGFREITLPIARYLGVPASNIFANRMNWQARPIRLPMIPFPPPPPSLTSTTAR